MRVPALGLSFVSAVALLAATVQAAESHSSSFTTSDGVRLHYVESGSGAPIVFQPGWTMPGEIFQHQIDYFSKSRHVVALDPRSQGQSQQATEGHYCDRRARDIKELADHLKLPPFVLVGWSQGVAESLCYVDQFGTSNLTAIVMVDGGIGRDPDPVAKVMAWRRFEEMQKDRLSFTEHFVRAMYRKPQTEEYLEKVVAASMITPTNTAVLMSVNSLMKDDYRPILYRIDRPALYIGRDYNRTQGETLRTYVPWARVEIFEDAGHAIFVDDADRFNQVLDEFLRQSVQAPKAH